MERVHSRHSRLGQYWAAWLVVLLMGVVAAWPAILSPLAVAYIRFCAAILAESPLFYHFPPYLVAMGAVSLLPLVGGGVVALVRQIVRQRRLGTILTQRRIPHDEEWTQAARAASICDRLIVTRETESYAFCAGLISPRIYISAGLLQSLTRPEIEAVLLHEAHHLRRRDPLRLFIIHLLQYLAPVLPAMKAFTERARIRIELAADEAALRQVPVEALATALVKHARAKATSQPGMVVAAMSPTDARINALLGKPIETTIERGDVAVTAAVALALLVSLGYLATLSFPMNPFCDACPPF